MSLIIKAKDYEKLQNGEITLEELRSESEKQSLEPVQITTGMNQLVQEVSSKISHEALTSNEEISTLKEQLEKLSKENNHLKLEMKEIHLQYQLSDNKTAESLKELAEARKETLVYENKLLELKNSRKSSNELIDNLRSQIREMEEEKKNLQETVTLLKSQRNGDKTIQSESKEIQRLRQQLRTQKEINLKIHDEFLDIKSDANKAFFESNKSSERLSDLQIKLTKTEELNQQYFDQISSLQTNLKAKENDINTLSNQLSALTEKHESTESLLQNSQSKVSESNDKISNLHDEITNLHSQIQTLQSEKFEIDVKILNFQTQTKAAEDAKRAAIDESEQLRKQLRETISINENKLTTAINEVKSLQNEIDQLTISLETKEAETFQLNAQVEKFKDINSNTNKDLANYKAEIEEEKEKRIKASTKGETLTKELEAVRNDLNISTETISRLKTQFASDRVIKAKAKEAIRTLSIQLKDTQNNLQLSETRINHLLQEVEEAKEAKAKAAEILKSQIAAMEETSLESDIKILKKTDKSTESVLIK